MKMKMIVIFVSILVLLGSYAVVAQERNAEEMTGHGQGHGQMMGQGQGMMMDPMMKDNMGMMGDVMMQMQEKMRKGQMTPEDMQKMCGMMKDMSGMMHEMKSGCDHATLQKQQKKLKGYESELEKIANEF